MQIAESLPASKTFGWLQRGGKTWRVYIVATSRYVGPVDDLYVGDRLTFPPMAARGRALLLRVVFRHGQVFIDEDRPWSSERAAWRDEARYELPAQPPCPACGCTATHDVTVRDVPKPAHITRTCKDCGHVFPQHTESAA